MRYFLYYEEGDDRLAPTLVSEQDIYDDMPKTTENLSNEAKIIKWCLDTGGYEIEYDGEGPINPRWIIGNTMCPFYTDCEYGDGCCRAATPDVLYYGVGELFEKRPRCHSKLSIGGMKNGRLTGKLPV